MGEIEVRGYICERCAHIWTPRIFKDNHKKPVVCPRCKSPYWDIPRSKKREGKK